ncbi:hypothetical protein CC86DRAFT_399349 [Ophiobolus disseminans]|uniref:Uncharacterized protein n=1 Tax=Ophiobolus disseminans TaxID=1469910 RepID=A0A6A6ZBP2_9PLEO|nr:hypothetical protein CC86DRAFT_399349 [Ophiobolus disseminans]
MQTSLDHYSTGYYCPASKFAKHGANDAQNEINFQRRQFRWLFAQLEEVMMEECHQDSKDEQSKPEVVSDRKQWERFIEIAQSKIKTSKQCFAPLARTAENWGMNKVQYYEWASMGWKYCNVLATAASQNPVWEEARIKLNQLLLRRIAEGRSLRTTINPIYLLDLKHLVAWPDETEFEKRGRKAYTLKYEPITESNLPAKYVFDQFGLIDHQLMFIGAERNTQELL